jgi:hypothetical protein
MKRVQKAEFTPTPHEISLLLQMRQLSTEAQETLGRFIPNLLKSQTKNKPALRLIQGRVKA